MLEAAVILLAVAGVIAVSQLWDGIRLLKGLPLSLVFLCGVGEEWLVPLAFSLGIRQKWIKCQLVETKGIGRIVRKAVIVPGEISPECGWCQTVYEWLVGVGKVDVDAIRLLQDDIRSLHNRLLEMINRPVWRRRLLPVLLVFVLVAVATFLSYEVLWVWIVSGGVLAISFSVAVFRPKVKFGDSILDCSIVFDSLCEELSDLLAIIRGMVRDGNA